MKIVIFMMSLLVLFVAMLYYSSRIYLMKHNKEVEAQYLSEEQKIKDFVRRCYDKPGTDIVTVPLPDGIPSSVSRNSYYFTPKIRIIY